MILPLLSSRMVLCLGPCSLIWVIPIKVPFSPNTRYQIALARIINDYYSDIFGDHLDRFITSAVVPAVSMPFVIGGLEMRTGSGENSYEWIDSWAKIPDSENARTGWAHHDMVVTEAGDLIAFHQSDDTMFVFDEEGNLQRSWNSGLTEAHGMTLVKEGETEYLWIADNGEKSGKETGYRKGRMGSKGGQVVKMTLDNQIAMTLQRPELPIYKERNLWAHKVYEDFGTQPKIGKYSPTRVAVNEERYGGNGDIWVADGYGTFYVHRYDKNGNYISSINGEEGDGHFSFPHGLLINRRGSEPELYIGEQLDGRVQVYDLDGKFKRAFGSGFLNSSSDFVTDGELLIVLELKARLAVLDADDNFICYLGDNGGVCEVEGWPNMENEKSEIVPPTEHLRPGKFNSPHGMAMDRDGNLYVAEWLIGGRITKLLKC